MEERFARPKINIEKFKRCNKIIDPIREVMFEIILTDKYVLQRKWDMAKFSLDRAKYWLAYAEREGKIREYYIGGLRRAILDMQSLLEEKDVDKWNAEMDFIIPDVINTVFLAFAECMQS